MSFADRLARRILDQEKRIEQLDRRLNNIVREAKVIEVDAAKGLVKVEGHGLKSGWMPWATRAGAIREWSPPAKGERVLLISPTGEPGQGIVLSGGYSSEFKQPSSDGGEHLVQVGDLKVSATKERALIGFPKGGRVVVKDKLVKLRVKETFVVLTEGHIIVSVEPEVGADPDTD